MRTEFPSPNRARSGVRVVCVLSGIIASRCSVIQGNHERRVAETGAQRTARVDDRVQTWPIARSDQLQLRLQFGSTTPSSAASTKQRLTLRIADIESTEAR